MANFDVNYQTLATNAKTIRSNAQDLNKYLTSVYQKIANMHNVWYGKRYETLVTEFNKIIPQINDLLDLVVRDIPFALESIANNYSQTDDGFNITSAEQTTPSKMNDLGPYSEGAQNQMKYNTEEVETIKNEVVSDFNNATSKMDTIKSVYDQTPWEGEAAETFRSTLSRLKDEIVTSFENLKTQFTNLMNQAQQDINAGETGNILK